MDDNPNTMSKWKLCEVLKKICFLGVNHCHGAIIVSQFMAVRQRQEGGSLYVNNIAIRLSV